MYRLHNSFSDYFLHFSFYCLAQNDILCWAFRYFEEHDAEIAFGKILGKMRFFSYYLKLIDEPIYSCKLDIVEDFENVGLRFLNYSLNFGFS